MIKEISRRFCTLSAIALVVAVTAMGADSAQTNDAAKKSQILSGPRWQQMMHEFDAWLGMQVLYSPAQVKELKAKLAAQVQSMSAAELEQFLDQWDAKLKVLLGRDAGEAREWLAQNLQVMADGYRKQFLQRLGLNQDITKMTAAQLEDAILRVRAERMAFVQQRDASSFVQQQQQQLAQRLQAETQTSTQNAGSESAAEYGSTTTQSPYSPRHYDYRPLPPMFPFWW